MIETMERTWEIRVLSFFSETSPLSEDLIIRLAFCMIHMVTNLHR